MEIRGTYGLGNVMIRPECLLPFPAPWQAPTGLEVRAALSMAGWSGEEFARRLGVNGRTVRRWLLDEKPISYLAWVFLAAKAGLAKMWE